MNEPDSESRAVVFSDLADRVLEKGIIIDADYRIALTGVHLVTVDMSVCLASLDRFRSLARTHGISFLQELRGFPRGGTPASDDTVAWWRDR